MIEAEVRAYHVFSEIEAGKEWFSMRIWFFEVHYSKNFLLTYNNRVK